MDKPHMRARRLNRFDEIRLQQQSIGVRLRQILEGVAIAPVPQEWLDLLRQADDVASSTDACSASADRAT